MSDQPFGPEGSDHQNKPSSLDDLDQLRRLAELHRDGVIDDAEFAAKKRQILGDVAPPPKKERRRIGKRGKIAIVAVLVVGIGGGGGTAMALQAKADREAAAERKALALKKEREQEKREAAEKRAANAAREAEELQKIEDDIEIEMRKSIVRSLRASVTKDFKGRVNDGILDGPILSTSCDPIEGGVDELDEKTGKYECLVATEKTGTGVRGYPVDATVNYTKGSYTWQLSG